MPTHTEGLPMTQTYRRSALALGLALLFSAAADALPFPRPAHQSKEPPLPAGAIRRFGKAVAAPSSKPPQSDIEKQLGVRYARDNPVGAGIALTPDGKQIVVGSNSGRIDVYDLSTGRLERSLQTSGPSVRLLTVSSDGRRLAASKGLGEVQVWDLPAGKLIQTFRVRSAGEDRGQVERLAFGPGGKVLFIGADAYTNGENGGATAWDPTNGKRLWHAPNCGYNIAADPRGHWVLTGLLQEEPSQLGLLDTATGKVDRRLIIEPSTEEADGVLMAVDASATLDRLFTPDGSRLVTIHDDGTVRMWDPEECKEIVRMKARPSGSFEPGGLAGSPDGRWAAVRNGREVQIWELVSGRQVYTITGLEASPREMVFTRDGRGLVASSGPAPILWSLRPTKDAPTDRLWELLAADDSTEAYRALWALIDNPKIAVPLFASKVRPAELVMERAKFDRLVTGLDSPDFPTRERAERDLTAAGFTVPPTWIRKMLAESKSEEVRARLGRILTAREGPSPARWRLERAVQALELARTEEAGKLLREWAAGPPGSVVTRAATAAVERTRPQP
jgi:outer membrane protein assembly factor BamB